MPVYNVADYLAECVVSLIDQDLQAYEILLIDDGSTDSSGEMCDTFAARYSQVTVIHKSNGGLGSARNTGVNQARGDYVIFVDADDYIKPNSLGRLYEIALKNDLDLLLYGAVPFSDDPTQEVHNHYKRTRNLDKVLTGPDSLVDALESKTYITSVCLRMMKRRFLRSTGLQFNENFIHEDEDYAFLSYLMARRTMIVSNVIYFRRWRKGSLMTTRTYDSMIDGYGYAIRKIGRYAETSNLPDKDRHACIIRCNSMLKTLLISYSRLSRKERWRVRSRLVSLVKQECRRSKLNSPILLFARISPECLVPPVRLGMTARQLSDMAKPYVGLLIKEPNATGVTLRAIVSPSPGARIFLIGTPHHGNIGDHLIAESVKTFVEDRLKEYRLIECTMRFSRAMLLLIKRVSSPKDVIAIMGGGWLGTEWRHHEEFVRRIIRTFPNNRIIVLPQTAYYDGDDRFLHTGATQYSAHRDLYLCAREQETYELFVKNGFSRDYNRVFLVPDMALLGIKGRAPQVSLCRRDDVVGVCLRTDIEASLNAESVQAIMAAINSSGLIYKTVESNENTRSISPNRRSHNINRKLDEISRLQLLVTDRLHAMIMAVLTRTPCIAFDNSTHKVKGVYAWLSNLNYVFFLESPDALDDTMAKALNVDSCEDCKSWRESDYLDVLANLFRKEGVPS